MSLETPPPTASRGRLAENADVVELVVALEFSVRSLDPPQQLLDLDDEAIVLQALSTLNELLEEGAIKRASSLKMRIKTAQMTVDTAEVKAAGDALLEKLR